MILDSTNIAERAQTGMGNDGPSTLEPQEENILNGVRTAHPAIVGRATVDP